MLESIPDAFPYVYLDVFNFWSLGPFIGGPGVRGGTYGADVSMRVYITQLGGWHSVLTIAVKGARNRVGGDKREGAEASYLGRHHAAFQRLSHLLPWVCLLPHGVSACVTLGEALGCSCQS